MSIPRQEHGGVQVTPSKLYKLTFAPFMVFRVTYYLGLHNAIIFDQVKSSMLYIVHTTYFISAGNN